MLPDDARLDARPGGEVVALGGALPGRRWWGVRGTAVARLGDDRLLLRSGQDRDRADALRLMNPAPRGLTAFNGIPLFEGSPDLQVRDGAWRQARRGEWKWRW